MRSSSGVHFLLFFMKNVCATCQPKVSVQSTRHKHWKCSSCCDLSQGKIVDPKNRRRNFYRIFWSIKSIVFLKLYGRKSASVENTLDGPYRNFYAAFWGQHFSLRKITPRGTFPVLMAYAYMADKLHKFFS